MPPTGMVKMANSQANVFEGLTPFSRRLMTIDIATKIYKVIKVGINTIQNYFPISYSNLKLTGIL